MTIKFPIFALLLIASLLLVAVGNASATAPAAVPFAFEEEGEEEFEEGEEEWEEGEAEEFEGEDEGFEDELGGTDCELGEEGVEEGLLTVAEMEELCEAEEEWEEEATGHSKDRVRFSCLLRTAKVHAATRRNQLKLRVGYSTHEPVKARIEVRVGKRKLGTVKRRLGRSGVLRISKRVGKKTKGKRIRLRIKLARGSAGCPSRRLALLAR